MLMLMWASARTWDISESRPDQQGQLLAGFFSAILTELAKNAGHVACQVGPEQCKVLFALGGFDRGSKGVEAAEGDAARASIWF